MPPARPTQTPPTDVVLATLWQRLTDLFPNRWLPAVGEWAPDSLAAQSWRHALTGLRPSLIAVGLNALVNRGDSWPPSAGEFRALCLADVPGEEAARAEAARAGAAGWTNWPWSHPVVYAAARFVGSWDCRHMTQRELRYAFAEPYRKAVARWVGGEDMTVPEILRLDAPRPAPCDPAAAAPHIAQLRKLLGLDDEAQP